MEFRKEVWIGDINLIVMGIYMVFRAMRQDGV